jgi:hypothetical protein
MKKKLFSYLAIFSLIITTVFTLSAFVNDPEIPGADDEADDFGLAGTCYTVSTYECSVGGFGVSCSFTGVYGSPYSCTSVGCGMFGAIPSTRKCVKKTKTLD